MTKSLAVMLTAALLFTSCGSDSQNVSSQELTTTQNSACDNSASCGSDSNNTDRKANQAQNDKQEHEATKNGACDNPTLYTVLEKTNLHGSGESDWNKQTAHPIHDLTSFADYLDTLRTRHLGEYFDGTDNSKHYYFDSYLEKYKTFDFSINMIVALEGGSQPSGGYDIEVASVCDNTIEYNVTWCNKPDVGYTADIGYPFMLISLPKGDYEYRGGTNPNKCQ